MTSLESMESALKEMESSAKSQLDACETPEALESIRVDVLGRKGRLAQVSKSMGKLTHEQRGAMGKLLNQVKELLEAAFDARHTEFSRAAMATRLAKEWVDLTLPDMG